MGRKRKPGPREPNGKPSRRKGDVAAQRKAAWDATQMEAMATALEARQRLFGLDQANARSQHAGSFIGRLYIGREISAGQYEALCAWEKLAREHAIVCGAPKGDTADDPSRVSGRSNGDSTSYEARVMEKYRSAHRAIQERQNELRGVGALFAALNECVERDREFHHLVGSLREASNALARHFKINPIDTRKAA